MEADQKHEKKNNSNNQNQTRQYNNMCGSKPVGFYWPFISLFPILLFSMPLLQY